VNDLKARAEYGIIVGREPDNREWAMSKSKRMLFFSKKERVLLKKNVVLLKN
jgi:hypothetical protein